MSRWDILLDRTNQAKIKTDYVNEVNKENEKKYWKERCDKAQDKFFDMIKAEELKEIFDLFEALGGPRFYWEHELGRHPYEVNPQWKDVCPDSRWAGGPNRYWNQTWQWSHSLHSMFTNEIRRSRLGDKLELSKC